MVDDLTNKITNQETQKVKELDKIVKVLVRKVLSLESEITEMKKNQIQSEGTEEKALIHLNEMNYINSQSSPKDVKVPEEKPVEEAEGILTGTKLLKKTDPKSDFKCEKCDYVCKKLSTIKNHVTTKHTNKKCKVCYNKFKSSMEIIYHVAKEHHKEDELIDIESEEIPKLDDNEATSFVCNESISDKLL